MDHDALADDLATNADVLLGRIDDELWIRDLQPARAPRGEGEML